MPAAVFLKECHDMRIDAAAAWAVNGTKTEAFERFNHLADMKFDSASQAWSVQNFGEVVSLLLLIVWVLWKELLFATFDPLGAGAAGLPVRRLDDLLLILIAVTIVVSLQAVGIVLVVAMITTPAATAQLLVKRFGQMIALAALIGVTSSLVGLYVSYALDIASGASIVLTETFAFLVALLITSIGKRVRANRAVAQESAR